MAAPNKPYVIIPNWNGVAFLADSLRSLEKQTRVAELIVVDNGSTDGSQELVRTKFAGVTLLEQTKNLGFAGGVNVGIKHALKQGAEFVALFNNDAVAAADWLEQLLAAAKAHPKAGIVTGKLLDWEGKTFDSTGDFYSVWGFSYPRGRGERDRGQFAHGEWVFGASGGASLYRANALKQVGLFDESYFAYYEDVDLSWRMQLAGWKVYYEPAATARHRIGATSGRLSGFTRYHSVKNFHYMYLKNMPGRLFWRYLWRFAVAALLMIVNSLRRGQLGPLARGYGQVTLHLPAIAWKRWRIQRNRDVSISYIDSILYHGIPPTQKNMLRLQRWLRLGAGRK